MLRAIVTGGDELRRRFGKAAKQMRSRFRAGLRRAAVAVESRGKRIVYGGHPEHLEGRSGHLRRSITHSVSEAHAEVGSNVVYARIHEYGGVITPVSGEFLRFENQEGEEVFVRSVTLPPRPYLRPALEEETENFTEYFGEEILEAFR